MGVAVGRNWIALCRCAAGLAAALMAASAAGLPDGGASAAEAQQVSPSQRGVELRSLDELSVPALRSRTYSSQLTYEAPLADACYTLPAGRPAPGVAYMASYRSDGLREYARIDVPVAPPPPRGYPVVVFAHGWVGKAGAPTYSFGCAATTGYPVYADLIQAYVEAGFVVVTPGYRGHGTIRGRPADGLAFLDVWDNATYISPQFYAVDILNLLSALTSPGASDALAAPRPAPIDPRRIHLKAHSQGGDAALTVAAVVGRDRAARLHLASLSIWAGTFMDRLVQLRTYAPMQEAPEAYLAGDGTWTGGAVGADGRVNPDFVFGYPDPGTDLKARPAGHGATVEDVTRDRLTQMYATLNRYVADLSGLSFRIQKLEKGGFAVIHDRRVVDAYRRLGGYGFVREISVPVALHVSDHDYNSLPSWNEAACRQMTEAGGRCTAHVYPGNTHELGLSKALWFSPPGSTAGFQDMVRRDLEQFSEAAAPVEGRR